MSPIAVAPDPTCPSCYCTPFLPLSLMLVVSVKKNIFSSQSDPFLPPGLFLLSHQFCHRTRSPPTPNVCDLVSAPRFSGAQSCPPGERWSPATLFHTSPPHLLMAAAAGVAAVPAAVPPGKEASGYQEKGGIPLPRLLDASAAAASSAKVRHTRTRSPCFRLYGLPSCFLRVVHESGCVLSVSWSADLARRGLLCGVARFLDQRTTSALGGRLATCSSACPARTAVEASSRAPPGLRSPCPSCCRCRYHPLSLQEPSPVAQEPDPPVTVTAVDLESVGRSVLSDVVHLLISLLRQVGNNVITILYVRGVSRKPLS